ncbi:TPA: hypothetical protein ACNR6I_004646, partial [Escherichia coli]
LIQGKSLASKTEISQADITFSDLMSFRISVEKTERKQKFTHQLKYQYQKQRIALFVFSYSTNC